MLFFIRESPGLEAGVCGCECAVVDAGMSRNATRLNC